MFFSHSRFHIVFKNSGELRKLRILFFNVPLHGHMNPTLDLVAELVKQGHHVVSSCSSFLPSSFFISLLLIRKGVLYKRDFPPEGPAHGRRRVPPLYLYARFQNYPERHEYIPYRRRDAQSGSDAVRIALTRFDKRACKRAVRFDSI